MRSVLLSRICADMQQKALACIPLHRSYYDNPACNRYSLEGRYRIVALWLHNLPAYSSDGVLVLPKNRQRLDALDIFGNYKSAYIRCPSNHTICIIPLTGMKFNSSFAFCAPKCSACKEKRTKSFYNSSSFSCWSETCFLISKNQSFRVLP